MSKRFYIRYWRNKWITARAQSIDDFIRTFEAIATMFRQWKEWGIQLSKEGNVGDDYAMFITDDMDVAINANFMVYAAADEESAHLQTLSGEDIKVPKEKLEQFKK